MFEIESARITAAGVSFQLPTGFVVLEAQEPHVNSTLALRAPDGSYQIIVSLDHSAQSSGDELRSILSEGGYSVLRPITPFRQNGLSGHSAAYLSGKRGYWELRVDLPDADGKNGAPNTLVFQLVTHWGGGILDLMNTPPLHALLQSIQPLSD